ncbi:MAG: alanine racemase [Ruminococcaceae bacterium]|nr:alanine racemase [Oscillospiraceae bacterium]
MSAYVVNRSDLSHNIGQLKRLANGVPIWAVIKGDGYGLGALPLAQLLYAQGIDRFCVTELREARLLRENGLDNVQILMLRSITDRDVLAELAALRVIVTVGSMESAEAAAEANAEVHLKIDTGMGRFGFAPSQLEEIASVYETCKVCGIYTHFPCAFCDDGATKRSFDAFCGVLDALRSRGIDPGMAHCCNSSAFFKFPQMHLDAVRLGSAILGRLSFPTKLQPVGHVQTHIDELHCLKKGQSTGYGAIFKAKRDTTLAIVPVGWFHGFQVSCKEDRSRRRDSIRGILSNLKTFLKPTLPTVKVGGRTCTVVGAIGMLHCAVDVTGLSIKPGDEVIISLNPLHRNGLPVEYK